MQPLTDIYTWNAERKILTFQEHGIVGIENLSYFTLNHAAPPSSMHYHANIIEFICMVKGMRHFYVNDEIYVVRGNELFINFPDELHGSGEHPLYPGQYFGVQVNLLYHDRLLGLNEQFSQALVKEIASLQERHYQLQPGNLQLIKNAYDCLYNKSQDRVDYYLGVQYLTCFFLSLSKCEPVVNDHPASSTPAILRTIEYIEAHYQEPLQVKDMAAVANYSLSSFKKKFLEELGITPLDYLVFRRIERTKELLETTDMSVMEIALACGFNSSDYFSVVFKKHMNVSPTRYRMLRQNARQNGKS